MGKKRRTHRVNVNLAVSQPTAESHQKPIATQFVKNKCKLNIISFNARSLRNKIDELRCLIKTEAVDVIAVTETFIDTTNIDLLSEYHIDGFKLFNKDRVNRRGGGVALYVATWLHPVDCSPNNSNVEHACVKIVVDKIKINISVTYRPPGQNLEKDNEMYNVLRQSLRCDESIILGDFNLPHINWLTNTGVEAESHRMLEFLEDNFLSQLVNQPTRENNILDLIIVSNDRLVNDVIVGEHLGSCDHRLLRTSINAATKITENKSLVPNFRRADFVNFRSEMSCYQLPEGLDVENAWAHFKNNLINQQTKFVPYSERRTNDNSNPPWINIEIKRKIRIRNKLHKQLKANNTQENQREYTESRREIKKLIKQSKRRHEMYIATTSKNNSKTFFKYINKKKNVRSTIGPLKDSDGEIITNDQAMASKLNEYFCSVFNAPNNVRQDDDQVNLASSNNNTLQNFVVTVEDVIQMLENLKVNKSPGPDNIFPKILKETKNEIVNSLTSIFNNSLQQGIVPGDWKTANVTPIFKKGDRNKPGNYRPISLTSVVGKLLESIIRDKIVEFLESNNLIKDSQHGFRQKRSCLSNLLTFYNDLFTEYDNSRSLDVVYLDFQKAFDKVPHSKLLVKIKQLGITGQLHKWIENWLSERKQRVVINGAASGWDSVTSGVPQGSVLGPVLFLIYINDIDNGLNNLISKFADDTKIGSTVITENDKLNLQNDLNKITDWSEKWEMPFNIDKCQILHVGTRNPKFDYELCGEKLKNSSKVKDLGVTVESNLKFAKQCKDAAAKANRMLGFIKRNFSFKSKEIVLPLYKSLVRPHLEYAVQFWSPHHEKDIAKLESVQRRATKMIPSLRNKSYEERLVNLNLFTLRKRRLRGKLIECFKILKGFTNVDFDKLFLIDDTSRTRNNGHKLKCRQVRSDCTKFFFTNDVVREWNKLPPLAVQCNTIDSFKNKLDSHLLEQGYR